MDLKNKYEKEAFIDLKEMCWRLLEQWKAIVITALVVMALFLGFMYVQNANNAKRQEQANQVQEQVTDEEILAALPEKDRLLVVSAYRLLQKREQFSEYICTTPIVEIDPGHINRLRVTFAVDKGGEDTDALTQAYIMAFQEDSCKNALLEASGSTMSPEQFDSLLTHPFPYQFEIGLVSCDIFMTEDMDAEALKEEMQKQTDSIHARLQNEFGEHRIVDYRSEVSVVSDQGLYTNQITYLNGFVNINNQLNNLKNGFSAEQEKAFSRLQGNVDKQVVAEQPQPAPKSISLLDIIVGLILGVLAYVVVFFLYAVISTRAISSSILKDSSVRRLGEWHSESEHNKKNWLISDRFVWKKHHRRYLDRAGEIDKITNALKSICSFKEIRELLLLLTAKCSQEQEEFVRTISDSLRESGINTKLVDTSVQDSDLVEAEGAALVIIDSKTRAKEFSSVFDRCNDYEKPIVGSIYLG